MLVLKAILAWVLILCLAIANGALREAVLIPMLGKGRGLVLSGLLLCLCVAVVAHGLVRGTREMTITRSLAIGVLWLSLTLVFEFGFGHYVMQKSWSELFAAYLFRDGNLWPLVPLVTVLAPYVATRWKIESARHARG